MNIVTTTLIGAGLICSVAGCSDTSNRPVETAEADERDSYREGTLVSASPGDMNDDDSTNDGSGSEPSGATRSATSSIAEARCAREATCENVGSDKTYSSSDDCMARIRDEWRDDLNARECPGGVNQTELDECLTAIRNEDCGSPFDTLARVVDCSSGQICVD